MANTISGTATAAGKGSSCGVQVRWLALCWENYECEPTRLYGVYAMGPSEDMDSPAGTLLGTYGHATDAADAAYDAALYGMWPDADSYRIEVRNVGSPAGVHGWDHISGGSETDVMDESCPF